MKTFAFRRKIIAGFLCITIGVCGCRTSDDSSFTYSTHIKQIEQNPHYQSWAHYLGDPERTHFSILSQIDTSNVNQLVPAWHYVSGEVSTERTTQIQTNPLIVGNTLYGISPANSLFSLNAATGEMRWEFNPPGIDQTGLGLSRGMVYWTDENREQARVFYASGYQLYAIDAENGKRIDSFGNKGFVDLRVGLGRDPKKVPIVMTTPGVIYKNLLITGHRTSESPGAAPGHIRAYDVINGELVWTFHTIPQPGEFGYETWPENAYKTSGGANNWAGMALDQTRGIVYVPTGSAAFDWYGGDRIGDNLFANSLIALNAGTGERLWHFQMVHHDLWDRDLPAPPNLVMLERDGKLIPAVAQTTKSGHVFIFNRVTGEPFFPIEEKPYPPTFLKGDTAAMTQPLPVKPAPFARQQLTIEDLYAPNQPAFVDDFIDKDQNISPPTVGEKLDQITSKGQFIPIDTTGVILYPGADGGAEWGGAAVDPRTGIMYVNSNEMAWIVRMGKLEDQGNLSAGARSTKIHCARCHGGALQGMGAIPAIKDLKEKYNQETIVQIISKGKGAMPGMPNLSDDEIQKITAYLLDMEESESADHRTETDASLPYAMMGFGRFKDNRGYPVVKPPWGTLNALDLNTGEYLWQVPLGHEKGFEDPEYPVSGTENYGGPVITAGGVLFIAATKDEKFRAINMRTGEVLWETELPAGGYATPATYEVSGRQFVVIACGGGKMGTASGATYMAFALPNKASR